MAKSDSYDQNKKPIQPTKDVPSNQSEHKEDLITNLERHASLKEKGILTEEEFLREKEKHMNK